jgi:predicted NAD/FAD-binding protein
MCVPLDKPIFSGGEHGLDIAVIGAGVSGLSCAWLLSQRHRVTLYEAAPRLGGHCCTVDVPYAGGIMPVDMGFIVYNQATYPNLTALFGHLHVPTEASCMSFAVSLDGGTLEYGGNDLAALFAQKKNIINPRFWAMLRDLVRFYRAAPRDMAALDADLCTLGAYLDRKGFSDALRDDHLLPMAAAIWSSPAGTIRDYPAAAFIRFCQTHGLLQLTNRPIWRTVTGGSRAYVERLVQSFRGEIRVGLPVRAVTRDDDGVTVHDQNGGARLFDNVVIATHGDQALAMLKNPTPHEYALLSAFRTFPNRAVLHRDSSLMPRRRAVWSSWNFLGTRVGASQAPCVTYWMNRLQNLPGPDLFVTLNPPREPAPGCLLSEQAFDHPVFDAGAIAAQRRMWDIQGERGVFFCGAHFGSGFHEDGLQAGLATAEMFPGVRRPWHVPMESGRIYVTAHDQRTVLV